MTKKETKEKETKNSNKQLKNTTKKVSTKKVTNPKKVEKKTATATIKKETTTAKKTVKKVSDATNKITTKKTSIELDTKKVANTKTKNSTKKDSDKVKKTTTKKDSIKITTKKTPSATKKTATKKKSIKTDIVSVIEYYDLPYKYNQTVVKILAQTPNILFVYWEISDEDRNEFIKHYGEDFFTKTKPVLIIHNETMNYSFEIEINDFANSWYLHINDANCKYTIELGRRPLSYISDIKNSYVYVSSSNKLDAPNDHVLFESFDSSVTYKNIKTGNIIKLDFSKSLPYSLYRKLYADKKLFKDLLDGKFTNSSSSPSF